MHACIDFHWTPQMNEELVHIETVARERGKGFMKRLKQLWNAKYPAFDHLIEKNLREHAAFVRIKSRRSCGNTENNLYEDNNQINDK